MEDDESLRQRKLENKMNFSVDLENGKYSNIYKSINKNLFNNDYFNFIKNIENKLEKEFMIFVRKNQYFLIKIILNDNVIYDLNNLHDSFKKIDIEFFENLNSNILTIFKSDFLKEESFDKNSIQINMLMLPKFKKNDINFSFENDVIKISFKIEDIEKLYLQLIKLMNEKKDKIENDEKSKSENFEKLENLFDIELDDLYNCNNYIKNDTKNESNDTIYENKNIFPIDLYRIIKKEMKKIFLNHIINFDNIFQSINKFISHIENYFPLIYNKCTKERLGVSKIKNEINQLKSVDSWDQAEQEKLEEALKIYKDEKDNKIKFKKVSDFVKTKSAKECIERFKYIVVLFKSESEKKLENNNISSNEKKIEVIQSVENNIIENQVCNQNEKNLIKNFINANNENEIIETDNKIILLIKESCKRSKNEFDKEGNSKKSVENKKEIKKENPESDKKNKELNDKEIKKVENPKQSNTSIQANNNISNLDTLDLVDQLLNQFDMNYLNIPTNLKKNIEITSNKTEENIELNNHLINIPSAIEEYPEELEEISDSEKEVNEALAYSSTGAKFDKNLNYTYNDKIKATHMQTILNIIKYGEKFAIQYSSVKLNRIDLAEICEVNFFIKCKKCKTISFETKFIKISNKINLFYCATICPKCKCHIQIIFKSELMHVENLQIAGITYSFGAIICDFLTSTFSINCLNCFDYYKKVKFRSGELSHKDRVCTQCKGEMNICTQNIQIVPYSSSNYSFLEELEINNFKTNTQILDSQDINEYVKIYEKKIKAGTPLPENGTCKHYHHSYKWFRFDCCCRYFPCDECHNDNSNHDAEWANLVLCGFCCFEQNSGNKVCASCGKSFSRDTGGNGFWEGGKGTRNKTFMSSKDSHKFKNSVNKTISKRKMKEMKDK